jgi:hypothetical protein
VPGRSEDYSTSSKALPDERRTMMASLSAASHRDDTLANSLAIRLYQNFCRVSPVGQMTTSGMQLLGTACDGMYVCMYIQPSPHFFLTSPITK